jgi:hypothetical protein
MVSYRARDIDSVLPGFPDAALRVSRAQGVGYRYAEWSQVEWLGLHGRGGASSYLGKRPITVGGSMPGGVFARLGHCLPIRPAPA